jgi:hypothetical protein
VLTAGSVASVASNLILLTPLRKIDVYMKVPLSLAAQGITCKCGESTLGEKAPIREMD